MEILDFFMDNGVKTSENYTGTLQNSSSLVLKDLSGDKPDYIGKFRM